MRGFSNPRDTNIPGTLFELISSTVEATDTPFADIPLEEEIDEAEEISQVFEGNRSADEYAPIALLLLVRHVFQQTDEMLVPLTYQNLAELLGRRNKHGEPWARGLGQVLGRVTALIDRVSTQLPESPPYLTSIVVLSTGPDAGLPDKGVSGRWPGYQLLPRMDKQAKVGAEYQRILQYGSHWNEVLQLVGLPPVLPVSNDGIQPPRGGWGGGESADHKALKRYVHDHPDLFGAASDWFAQEEYALRSGDELDVMFMSDNVWIGIEVKSKISDKLISDYERGLYQVVKYRAVLEAQALVDHPSNPPLVRAILVIESKLPYSLQALASKLKVSVLERVGVL